MRPLSIAVTVIAGCNGLFAQTAVKPLPAASKTEPGLESAVNWKWWVAPTDRKEWGMPLPESLMPKTPDGSADGQIPVAVARPETYEVKKGDAIIKIARKFDMTPAQLKQFNDMKDDRIIIGQVLRIPSLEQLLAMVPPPPPPEPKEDEKGRKKLEKTTAPPEPDPYAIEAQIERENVLLQVFLDREMFSPGAIDGKPGATFMKISGIYQRTHPDAADAGMLKMKAEAAVKQPFTTYTLRAEDFKFIKLPESKEIAPGGGGPPPAKKRKSTSEKPAPPPPPVTIDGLMAADFLCYENVWEFVAERFHCDEAFLRHLNPQVKGDPVVGSEFQVPNVIPFEIEKALDQPLQPAADPQKPVTAAVVVVSRLEITCEGKLIAVMPLASARPGLHGRGSWTVLDAIPQPRMATKREARESPKAPSVQASGDPASPVPVPVPEPPMEKEQYLASGPNNPAGIIWINLAKKGSAEPLPYGLHGTSIPSQMGSREGIGGLRLTNWNIARAVRLIPAGTPLQWKAQ